MCNKAWFLARDKVGGQELDEDELAERIRQKLQLHGAFSIDEILVSVGEDVDLEREEGLRLMGANQIKKEH